MALFFGVAYKYVFGRFGDLTLGHLDSPTFSWAKHIPFHSSPCLIVLPSEIEWDSSALLWELHLLTLDSLSWLWITCYSWVFPDILDGLKQRCCWAHDWRLFRASPSDCERFLSLFRGSSRIGYSSGACGSEDLHLVSGCAAPAEGLTLDNQLARDPSSGCIATTRISLPGSKWTSVKILCHLLLRILFMIVYDWFFGYISSLHRRYKNQLTLILHSCTISCLVCLE
jgi:hypothetical protein